MCRRSLLIKDAVLRANVIFVMVSAISNAYVLKNKKNKPYHYHLLASDTAKPAMESDAVVSRIGSKTETVLVRISISNYDCTLMHFIVDTSSNW